MHLLYKKQGETCLEAIERLRSGLEGTVSGSNRPDAGASSAGLQNRTIGPMTYAGRLDPLAAGLLIVLEGQDEIAKKATYLDMRKTYEFEVVFGVSTDTFDQLGIIVPSTEVLSWPTLSFGKESRCDIFPSLSPRSANADPSNPCGIAQAKMSHLDLEQIRNFDFKKLIGKVKQTYPFYSSKPIDGVPLFQYVKDRGIEATIPKLPTNEVEIFNIEILHDDTIDPKSLAEESIRFANVVKGDFRQNEIIESWLNFEKANHAFEMRILKCRMTASSGFYIRSFACWLGQVAGTGAIARNIVRTRVGDFRLD